MKQTNSAIKFLLAQYRAIFKHAQLASILAIAAAAGLSIGQANAAAGGAVFGNDQIDAADAPIIIDGTTTAQKPEANHYGKLELTGTEERPTNKPDLTITINGGANTIKGVAEVKGPGNAAPAKPYIDLGTSSITIDATTPSQSDAELTIGLADAQTDVFMGALAAKNGTLTVGADQATKTTSVSAAEITLGAESKTATVNVKGNATLAGSGVLSVGKGATLNIASSGAAYGSSTTVAGGTVALGTANGQDAAVLGNTGDVTVSSGKVTVAATAVGAIKGANISLEGTGSIENSGSLTIGEADKIFTMSSGTITNDAKSLIFAGTTNLNGGTIKNKGTVEFNGTTTVGEDVLSNSGDAAVWQIGNAKVTVSTKTLAAMKTGNTAKVVASGAEATNVSELAITGDAVLNLGGVAAPGTATETDLEFIDSTNGQMGGKFANSGTGIFKLSGNKATYTQGATITGGTNDLALQFGTLELGNGTADFSLGAKAAVSVTDGLTIKAGADGTAHSLLLKGGSLTLTSSDASAKAAAGKTVSAEKIVLGEQGKSAGTLAVNAGTWNIKGLEIVSGTASVAKGANLTVSTDLTTTNADGKLDIKGGVVDAKGVTTLSLGAKGVNISDAGTLILSADKVVKTSDGSLVSGNYETGSVTGTTDSMISLVGSGGGQVSMTAENFKTFRKNAGFSGLFDIKIDGELPTKPEMSLDPAQAGSVIAGVTNGYEGVQGTVGNSGVTDNFFIGNVQSTDSDTVTLKPNGALTLSNANAGEANGQYVSDKDGGVGKVKFEADNTLALKGTGGKIGSITNTTDGSGSVTVGQNTRVEVVSGDIGSSGSTGGAMGKLTLQDGGSITVDSGSVFTNNLTLGTGSSLNVGSGDVVVKQSGTINGDVTATNLTLGTTTAPASGDGVHTIAGNAKVDVTKLSVESGNFLFVGDDGDADAQRPSTSASVFTDTLDLKAGSVLFVDPSYKEKAAFVVAQDLGKKDDEHDAGTLAGGAFVGMNSALGIGFTEDEFKSYMAEFLNTNVAFNEDGAIKNALVLNKGITVDSGNGIEVNPGLTADKIKDGSYKVADNSLVMKSGGGLILTENAFGANKDKAAITFELGSAPGAATSGSVSVDAGTTIALAGKFSSKDDNLKFFAAQSTNNGGGTPAVTAKDVTLNNDIKVVALGGLLTGTIKAGPLTANGAQQLYGKGLELSPEAKTLAYAGVSRPVGDMFLDVADGVYDTANGAGLDFVTTTMSKPGGYKVVDAAAHAATYAGAQQAAVAAVTTMAEAVGGRVGSLGVEAASISATGSQANGGVWLTPMYKSVDADGFAAEGATYGADVDLAGVAFGTDTVNGNMRFGAVFNIGSGDADGKGNGNGLKDEFDYYGFGIYSVMGFGQLAIVGDASLNVISHEVEAAALGVKGKADTTAVTMGVTGQYAISTPSVDVVPHLGARFIRLDTDSYDLSSADGAFATTDFDVQNVFSIPLGVSFSKAIEMGGWSLAPSADLSVTFNTGDTDAKSTTMFHGMHALNLTSEVLDEVTYGVAVGLGAQYGAFGTNIGINYTGSENTDSFGVNAQARYAF